MSYVVRLEIFMVMKIQVTVFQVMTLCSDVVGIQTFWKTMLPPCSG